MDLQFHIERLENYLRREGDAPDWKGILVMENFFIENLNEITLIPKSKLYSIESYSKRFEELLDKGYSWINLVGNGVKDGNLIVSVELPKRPVGVIKEKISVNLSGPYRERSGKKIWNIQELIKFSE